MCNALHHKEGSGPTSPVKKQRHSIHTAAQQKEQNLSETATPTYYSISHCLSHISPSLLGIKRVRDTEQSSEAEYVIAGMFFLP